MNNIKPILFSGPMVRALLDGRKTQTLRILKKRSTLTPEPRSTMNNHVNAGGSPSAPGGRASAGEIEKEMPPGEPAGGSAARRKVRAAFYIDGFNLYHAIDRMGQPHLKWLNLRLVAEALIERKEEIVRIVWCSAEPKDNDKKHRHQGNHRHRLFRRMAQ